jgi:hypothetical protein
MNFRPSLLLSQNPVGVGHLLVYARLPHGSESGPLVGGVGLLFATAFTELRPLTKHFALPVTGIASRSWSCTCACNNIFASFAPATSSHQSLPCLISHLSPSPIRNATIKSNTLNRTGLNNISISSSTGIGSTTSPEGDCWVFGGIRQHSPCFAYPCHTVQIVLQCADLFPTLHCISNDTAIPTIS